MKSHLRIDEEQRQIVEDLDTSAALSEDEFSAFDVDDYTIGYMIKSLKTGEMVDTGIRIFKQDAGTYEDLDSLFNRICKVIADLRNSENPAMSEDFDDSNAKLGAVCGEILSVSKAAITEFDAYFGEGSMSGVTTARFGRATTPLFSFTLAVLSHIAAVFVVGTTKELHTFSSSIRSAIKSKEVDGE